MPDVTLPLWIVWAGASGAFTVGYLVCAAFRAGQTG